MKLADQCAKFAEDLLSLCRSTREVEMVLKRGEGTEKSLADSSLFPRVMLAVEADQKKVQSAPCKFMKCVTSSFQRTPNRFKVKQ